jgi:enoyl-CoA hydratase
VLDRPEKKNALSIALRDAISETFDDLAKRTETKVVIVTGSGDVFSAGFDLAEFGDADRQTELWESSDRFHHAILRCPLPTIAAINGPALAGGFDLACLCDIRIASTSARFAHPEQRWTTVLYRTLHDLVGGAIARDLVLTGRSVDADEARTIGLVVDVVPPDRLMEATRARAAMIAEAPRDALIATKAKIIAVQGIAPDMPTLAI